MTEIMAADVLWRVLRSEGVEIVFGHPGGAILPVYDALYRSGAVRHVLCRHEQGAAHAADGYARATGRVGVCMATSGPGATNLVTGLATAWMDSVPLVAITGQVPLSVMGTQAFQETDIVEVTRPVTKGGYLVRDPNDLADTVHRAFELARSGRPGPVLIDLPKCVQKAPCAVPADDAHGFGIERRRETATAAGHDGSAGLEARSWSGAVEQAARLVDTARRPVVMAGRGVVLSKTSAPLRELAHRADLPVTTTLLGLDAFSPPEPRALGMPGMHGTERANRAIQEADLILGLGLRFDDRVTGPVERFAPDARIVHFDVSHDAIGRTVPVDLPVVGDLRETLPALAARVGGARRPEWWRRLETWERERIPEPATPEAEGRLTGRVAIRALARRIADAGAVAVTDVGQHQMWMAQELHSIQPATLLTSGGLGTMGYGLPAGIGAACGLPERPVWVVAGDGGFQMTLQELATVAQEGLRLRIAVVNNSFLGMVRQWQELFYGRRYSATELSGPDLVLLARSYGILARAVSGTDELEECLDWAEGCDGPSLLDLRVVEEENVYPMVPTGAALHEMVSGPRATASAGRGA